VTGVILHCAALDPDADEVARLAGLINTQERLRAGQFRFDRDRRRFVVRRGRLREMLGDHVGEAPDRLRFEAEPFGKPRLHGLPCHFSASHSGERMVLAISDTEVGCDIEQIVEDFDWQPIAERLFTATENDQLAALPELEGLHAFFRCWARKEAFVKGLGLGLSYPLDAFDVSVEEEARFLSGGEGWQIDGRTIESGYAFAVVAKTASPLRLSPILPRRGRWRAAGVTEG
jgi:4'-phosphopantetheinyl transferase